jgi:hypothetical protein
LSHQDELEAITFNIKVVDKHLPLAEKRINVLTPKWIIYNEKVYIADNTYSVYRYV